MANKKRRKSKPQQSQETEITTLLSQDADGTLRNPKGRFVKGAPQETNKNGLVGRPTIMTSEVLQKLTHAYSLDATDEEACAYADISPRTLYNYQEKHPEFVQYKNRQKQLLILKSRQTVINDLDSPATAWKYLSKKGADFQQDSNVYVQMNFLAENKEDEKVESYD